MKPEVLGTTVPVIKKEKTEQPATQERHTETKREVIALLPVQLNNMMSVTQPDFLLNDDSDPLSEQGNLNFRRTRIDPSSMNQALNEMEKWQSHLIKQEFDRLKSQRCMQYMIINLDEKTRNDPDYLEIARAAFETNTAVNWIKQELSPSITWSRSLSSGRISEEDTVVLAWSPYEFYMILNGEDFFIRLASYKEKCNGKKLILVTYSPDQQPSDEIEDKMTMAQLQHGVDIHVMSSVHEMVQFIIHLTKSMAEKPFKLYQRKEVEGIGWLANDSKSSVRVVKHGYGMSQLWVQQLMQFSGCNLDAAQAIANVFQTPVQLFQELSRCPEGEGENLLRDITVLRERGESVVLKRIGPELSKKIYHFMMSTDGDLKLSQQ